MCTTSVVIVAAIVATMILLTALVNWKLPIRHTRRAEMFTRIFRAIMTLAIVITPQMVWLFDRQWPPDLSAHRNVILWHFLIIILSIPLSFITAEFIRYAKNKSDIEIMKDTIKGALIYSISTIVAVLAYIFFAYVYLF